MEEGKCFTISGGKWEQDLLALEDDIMLKFFDCLENSICCLEK